MEGKIMTAAMQAKPFADGSRILVLTSSSTGNNVFCTPAIRLLRRHLPNAVIDVAALSKLSAEVFEGNEDINHLYVISKASALDKLAKSYDQVIALNTNALKKLAGYRCSLISIGALVDGIHHAEQLLQYIANLLDCKVVDEDRHYKIGPELFNGKPVVDRHVLGEAPVLINIHLGCGRTLLHGWKFFYRSRAQDKKMWPIEAYIALGKALVGANPNIRIVVTGTTNESYLARQFAREVPGTINLAGKTSVGQLADMMHKLDLFIAHDCGVLHIASSSDVPIVSLFGPTNHLVTGPFPSKPQHIMLKSASMMDITPGQVFVAAKDLLQRFPRKSTPKFDA